MKLLVEIPDDLFDEVQRLTHAKKKREVVLIPMEEYRARKKRESVIELIGSLDYPTTLTQLKETRKQWKKS